MYGTLRGALVARQVPFDQETYKATVQGVIKGKGRAIRIVAISIHYQLTVPADTRGECERALQVHPQGCPAHQSVKDAIEVSWTADISEV
jgi:uncharacterized OsmC-like protein